MKIKIGTMVFSSEDQPIMVILDKQDKENIAMMPPEATKYCQYPDTPFWIEDNYKNIIKWMSTKKGTFVEKKEEEINDKI